MNTLYLITGPAGVGKSTISKKIVEKLPKSCMIEGDDVYHLVVGGYVSPWKKGNQLNLFWKNSISLIKNCLKENFDVVFNYILDKKDVEEIKTKFKKFNIVIKFVVLLVDEKTIIERDKMRPEDCQMKERSVILLHEMLDNKFDSKNVLETTFLTVDETYKEILKSDRFIV